MGAFIWKNEATPASRTVRLVASSLADNSLAPRSTDFTGYVTVSQSGSSIPGTGTISNYRRALTLSDDVVEATDTGADTVTMTGHAYETGDGPVRVDTTVGGLSTGVDYWLVAVGAGGNTVAFAASAADAYAGTYINLTADVTGVTVTASYATYSTKRGVDGHFDYVIPQTETNFDGCELVVEILGHATYYAFSSCGHGPSQIQGFESTAEGSYTQGDIARLIVAMVANAPVDWTTGSATIKSLDGTKTRATVTFETSGSAKRLTITFGDLT